MTHPDTAKTCRSAIAQPYETILGRFILLAILVFSGPAFGRCRVPVVPAEPVYSNEERFSMAKNVYLAYISAVSIDEPDETLRRLAIGDRVDRCRTPAATLRLLVVKVLKGEAAETKTIAWTFSPTGPGSLGSTVTAYEGNFGWYLDDGKLRSAPGGFTQEELDRLPRAVPVR
jgi:hypothetical protein